jgi:hypothetical protein
MMQDIKAIRSVKSQSLQIRPGVKADALKWKSKSTV